MSQEAEVQNQKNIGKTVDQSRLTEVSRGDDVTLGIRTGDDDPGRGITKTRGGQGQVTGALK